MKTEVTVLLFILSRAWSTSFLWPQACVSRPGSWRKWFFQMSCNWNCLIKITWAKDSREIRPGGNYKMTLVENTASDGSQNRQRRCWAVHLLCKQCRGKDSCSAHLGVQGTCWSEVVRAHFNFWHDRRKCTWKDVFRTRVWELEVIQQI